MSKAAELIVKCLENEGVEVVFGLPGEENIRFVQALASSKIRYVLTRHEQAASFMAEMYGRVTGRAAVVSATLGPGRSTCSSVSPTPRPTARRWSRSPPRSVRTGSTRSRTSTSTWSRCSRRSPAGPPTSRPPRRSRRWCAKRSSSPRPSARPRCISPCPSTSMPTRPTIPSWSHCRATSFALTRRLPARWRVPSTSCVRPVRPVLLAGHGAARSDATDALVRFSEKFDMPVANTFHGKGVMPDDHPNSIGALGFMRHDYVNFGFDNADVDHRCRI